MANGALLTCREISALFLVNHFIEEKVELLTIHFMKRTSQSYEKTLSGFVLSLIEDYHQDYRGTFLRNVISACRKSLYKRLLIKNKTTFLHSDCFGM